MLSCDKDTLYSFDVFDTLITRVVAHPTHVFRLMQDVLQQDASVLSSNKILKQNFCEIRISKEDASRRIAKKHDNKEDCTFQDIYKKIKQDFELTQDEADFLMNLEIDMEYKVSLPIPENIDKVVSLQKAGCKVVLISDMYLPESVIRKLLCKHNAVFQGLPIYVSGDVTLAKGTGNLYKHVRQVEKPTKWIHTGDNQKGDVICAKKYVTQAIYYPFPKLMDHEKDHLKTNPQDTLLVGVARYCRMLHPDASKIYQYGGSFSAPILYSYLNYVLSIVAKIGGIRDLYFIARDGYVLQKMCDIVIKARGLAIKTHYFYSSRVAARIITASNYDDFLHFSFNNEGMTSLVEISDRLCVNIDYFKKLLGLQKIPSHKPISRNVRENIFKTVLKEGEVRSSLIKINEERVALYTEYLKQEIGERKAADFAFVELQGYGITQQGIADFIEKTCGVAPHNFYFSQCIAKNFLPTKPMHFFMHYIMCSEYITRAPHGRTINYKRVGDKIEPVLEMQVLQPMVDWGFDDYLSALLDYTKIAAATESVLDCTLSSTKLVDDYYIATQDDKHKELSEFIGDIPYSFDGSEEHLTRLCPPFNVFSILKHYNINADKFSGIGYYLRVAFCRSPKIVRLEQKILMKVFRKTRRTWYSLYDKFTQKPSSDCTA